LDFTGPAILIDAWELILRTQLLGTNTSLLNRRSNFGQERTLIEHELHLDGSFFHSLSAILDLSRQRFEEPGEERFLHDAISTFLTYEFDLLNRIDFSVFHLEPGREEPFTFATLGYEKNYQIGSQWAYRLSHTTDSEGTHESNAGVGYLFGNGFRLNVDVSSEDVLTLEVGFNRLFDFENPAVGQSGRPPGALAAR
jgi:hypothetical protein